ncbi:MAG: sulfotransferase domain-containing protein [Paracoccaceae bacterium]
MKKACPETIFTLSAGRTGTAWLSEFLAVNLNCEALHEPLGVEDFGNRMPDIKIMRSFNENGNNAIVKDFWKRKFSMLTSNIHIETNHTLGKCGLIENISRSKLAEKSRIIILKRDIVRQCASYVVRHDFVHITTAWQWYLHPSYQKNLSIQNYFHNLKGLDSLFGIATKWQLAKLIISFISAQKLSSLTRN